MPPCAPRNNEAEALLEEFIAVVAHDLRSPIWGAASLTAIVRENLTHREPDLALRNLARLERRIAECDRLAQRLVGYAQDDPSPQPVVQVLLGEVVAECLAQIPVRPGIEVRQDLPAQPFAAAREHLRRVLHELLANAAKHHDRPSGLIDLRARLVSGACLIDLRDDGPGIPAQASERVFQLFQTLSPDAETGSGVGLAMARRLARRCGGDITLHQRTDGRGVRFRVVWPLAAEARQHG